MTTNNKISPIKFYYNTSVALPEQYQGSRYVLKDLNFWDCLEAKKKKKTVFYNRRNTVQETTESFILMSRADGWLWNQEGSSMESQSIENANANTSFVME